MNRFTNMTDGQLVKAYQKECGNPGWVSSRATYLNELRQVMKERFDCGEIITDNGGFLLSEATVSLRNGKVLRL